MSLSSSINILSEVSVHDRWAPLLGPVVPSYLMIGACGKDCSLLGSWEEKREIKKGSGSQFPLKSFPPENLISFH